MKVIKVCVICLAIRIESRAEHSLPLPTYRMCKSLVRPFVSTATAHNTRTRLSISFRFNSYQSLQQTRPSNSPNYRNRFLCSYSSAATNGFAISSMPSSGETSDTWVPRTTTNPNFLFLSVIVLGSSGSISIVESKLQVSWIIHPKQKQRYR